MGSTAILYSCRTDMKMSPHGTVVQKRGNNSQPRHFGLQVAGALMCAPVSILRPWSCMPQRNYSLCEYRMDLWIGLLFRQELVFHQPFKIGRGIDFERLPTGDWVKR